MNRDVIAGVVCILIAIYLVIAGKAETAMGWVVACCAYMSLAEVRHPPHLGEGKK